MNQREFAGPTLTAYLQKECPPWRLLCFRELDSTNRYAKALACEEPGVRALILAESQTKGRGRMGRSFYSQRGAGLYFSLVFPVEELSQSLSLTCAASVAVMGAVEKLTGKAPGIKWVNDLILDDRKVAGILAEGVTLGEHKSMIIGIGINVGHTDFPPELAEVAGSLEEDSLSHELLLLEIFRRLFPYIENPARRDWIDDYRARSAVLGRQVKWLEGDAWQYGIAEDIDGDGALTVLDGEGNTHRLSTGEITLRSI